MKSHCDTLPLLRRYESRNVTFIDPDGAWPIVWDRARGMHVWDERGKKYLDLTAAFGVAAAGHANARVVRDGQEQMERLAHAMGDVHPHAGKARLVRELSRLTFERWGRRARGASKRGSWTGKTILGNSGFEAVEAALKTARLATGRKEIIAFEGGYHGLGYGALNATHRPLFREPFLNQLGGFGHFVPFPETNAALSRAKREIEHLLRQGTIGAVLVEPVQGRGGNRVPPPPFLRALRRLCNRHGALLVLDEIYTGFGRTGKWFACEHAGVIPDLICLGKALTGGFPLSACVGRADLMDAAWPASTGEALHTSTYLGHPVGCAMALAQIGEIRSRRLVNRSAATGSYFLQRLGVLHATGGVRLRARGMGLMLGLELSRANGAPAAEESLQLMKALLRRGFILLPEGAHGNVISFTPPLTITRAQVDRVVAALSRELRRF